MSMYSSLEGTNVPSSQSGLPNVSQYGWSSYEMEEYKQLIEYVNEAKTYADQIGIYIQYIDSIKQAIDDIKSDIDKLYQDSKETFAQIVQIEEQIKTWYGMIDSIKTEIISMKDEVSLNTQEVRNFLTQVIGIKDEVSTMKAAILVSEANAKASEVASKTSEVEAEASALKSEEYYSKCYELYEALRKGQIYRGSWNPHTNAYPDAKGTNSIWDVVLNEGEQEYTFDNKRWYWGDRLFYAIDDTTYYQLESGSNVKSVNGKTGAVVLNPADVGAVNKAGDIMVGNLSIIPTSDSYNPRLLLRSKNNRNSWIELGEEDGSTYHGMYMHYNGATDNIGRIGMVRNGSWYDSIRMYRENQNVQFAWDTDTLGVIFEKGQRVYSPNNKPTATSINAFKADGKTGHVSDDPGVSWDANSGVYTTTISGESRLVAHFKGDGSCPALQIRAGYKNSGLWYRSARDSIGFEQPWARIYTDQNKPTPADIGAVSKTGDGTITGSLTVSSQVRSGGATHKAIMAASGAAGEFIFGGSSSGGHDATDYIRIGRNKFQYYNGVKDCNIYHEGNKPTASDVGAVNKAGDTMSGELYNSGVTPLGSGFTIGTSSKRLVNLSVGHNGQAMLYINESDDLTKNGLSVRTISSAGMGSRDLFRIDSSGELYAKGNSKVYHVGNKPTANEVGAADVTVGNEIKLLTTSNSGRTKEVQVFSKEGRLYGISADGTKTQFYNDRTYRPTLSDFGGLGVDNGNELNPPSTKSSFYFGYRKTGAVEIDTYHFMNNKAQLSGYGYVNAKDFFANGGTDRVYHTGNKPSLSELTNDEYSVIKTYRINAPAGVQAGKWYPVLLSNLSGTEQVLIDTKHSGGSDPMNNCSFEGQVRGSGWSDGLNVASGLVTIYQTNERAIHSLVCPSEQDKSVAFYVEGRSFPISVRVRSGVSVSCTGKDMFVGTTVFKANVTLGDAPAASDYGTKVNIILNFNQGGGVYNADTVYTNSIFRAMRSGVAFETQGGVITAKDPRGVSLRGKDFAFVSAPTNTYLTQNCYWDGTWSKYDNSKSSSMLAMSAAGPRFYMSDAGSTSAEQNAYKIYHEGFKPNADDVNAIRATDIGDLPADIATWPNKPKSGIYTRTTAGAAQTTVLFNNVRTSTGTMGFVGSYEGHLSFVSNVDSNRWRQFKIYTDTSKPTPADIGAVSKTGDTMTGPLALNASNKQLTFVNSNNYISTSSNNIYIAANNTDGKVILEGKANPRVRLNLASGTQDHAIYHTGFKPTASEVGALPVGGKAESSKTSDSLGSTNLNKTYTSYLTVPNTAWWGDVGTGHSQMVRPDSVGLPVTGGGYAFKVGARDAGKGHAWLYLSNYSDGGALYYGAANDNTKTPSWSRVYSDRNKPTPADVGAVNKAGDTMTGNLTIANSGTTNDAGITIQSQINRNSYLQLRELDNTGHHGMFVGYEGATDNRGRIGMIQNGSWKDILVMTRDSGYAEFKYDVGVSGKIHTKKTIETATGSEISLLAKNPTIGANNGIVRGPVEGGSWETWRSRSAGLLVECIDSAKAAYNVWKATDFATRHIASMDVHAGGGTSGTVNLHVGDGSADFIFRSTGIATSVGGWQTGSDERFKEQIKPLSRVRTSYLEKVCSLTASSFVYKGSNSTRRVGFIAQDVQPILPEAVSVQKDTTTEDGQERLFLDPTAIIAAQNEAIKELNEITKSQQAQIDELRAMVLSLTK